MKKSGSLLWAGYIFTLCGILACLWAAQYALNLKFPVLKMLLYVAGFSFIMWFCRRKWQIPLFLFYIPFGIVALILRKRVLLEALTVANTVLDRIYEVYDVFLGYGYSVARNRSDTSLLVFLGISVISVFLLQLFFAKKRLFLPFLLILPLAMGGVLLGRKAPEGMILLFLLYYVGTCAIKSGKRKLSVPVALLLPAFVLLAFGAGFLLSPSERMGDFHSRTIAVRDRAIEAVSRNHSGEEQNGYVSRRERTSTQEERMTLISSARPEKPLYLKGFVGAEYENGKWLPAGEEDFSSLYYSSEEASEILDRSTGLSAEYFAPAQTPKKIEIFPQNREDSTYRPYFSLWEAAPLVQDAALDRSLTEGETYSFYEGIDSDAVYDIPLSGYFYEDFAIEDLDLLREEYDAYVNGHYVSFSKERFPKLYELCQNNPQDTLYEITDFIVMTLQQQASYTLTPDPIPANVEIPEYFLFEGHEGYCVHFATTAVLLYRMYGIPARYVTGYMIPTDRFQTYQNNLYQAKVTSEDAHAWVEIYIQGFGWYPVEVTPAAFREQPVTTENTPEDDTEPAAESDPEQDQEEPEQPIEDEQGTAEGDKIGEISSADTQKDSVPIHTPEQERSFAEKKILSWILILIGIILIYLLVRKGLQNRRRKLYQRLRDMDVRQIFTMLLRLLHSHKLLLGYDGQEENFTEMFHREFPDSDPEENDQMIRILFSAAYGNVPVTQEEKAFVLMCYRRTAKYIYQNSGKLEQFRLRYLSGYVPF